MKKRIISMVLVLALLVSVLSMSALAAIVYTVNEINPGANVSSLTLSLDAYTANRTDETFTFAGFTNTRYTYNITVPPTVANNAQITITFAPDGSTVVSTVPPQGQPGMWIPRIMAYRNPVQTVTLSNGVGNKTVYVHRQLLNGSGQPVGTYYGQCDVYIFNFEKGYPVSISTGDPVYINWSTTNVTSGTVQLRNANGVLPDSFTLWVQGTGAVKQNGTTIAYDYEDEGNYAYTINLLNAASTVTAVFGDDTYTISVPAKPSGGSGSGSAGGVSPTSVVSYLPIGQFATGGGWGTSSGKFAGKTSLDSTGVSLGALGGYIEFYFANGITDNPNNPYGVDFVVYGNAFAGNPEAGAVQVSENGSVWYELAGSMYYDGGFNYNNAAAQGNKFSNVYTGTLRNTSVAYSLISSGINVTFGGYTNLFTNLPAWWPTTGEGYPMGTPHTNSVVTVSHSDTALSFGGITAVHDSNVTADYAFGYADVTPNGSPSQYGAAVNPYTAYTSGKTGGDGFDLAWAVDITTGAPVDVTNKNFKYVRVYSNVLDNGTFGETSCEVCGIFTAIPASTSVGVTATPTITVNNSVISATPISSNVAVCNLNGLEEDDEISVSAVSGAKIWINNLNNDEYSVAEDDMTVRVIVQNGNAAPYIVIIK